MKVAQDQTVQSQALARAQGPVMASSVLTVDAGLEALGPQVAHQWVDAALEALLAWVGARRLPVVHQDQAHPVAQEVAQMLKSPTQPRMKEKPNGAKTNKPAQPKKIKKIQIAKKTVKA